MKFKSTILYCLAIVELRNIFLARSRMSVECLVSIVRVTPWACVVVVVVLGGVVVVVVATVVVVGVVVVEVVA